MKHSVIVGKFGGGDALADLEAVKGLPKIVQMEMQAEHNILVVSAMGKTTKDLVAVYKIYECGRAEEAVVALEEIFWKFEEYCWELFPVSYEIVNKKLSKETRCRIDYMRNHFNFSQNAEQAYSKIVSLGEIYSWYIVSQYLADHGFENSRIDSREMVKTKGSKCIDAVVDINQTFIRAIRSFEENGLGADFPKFVVVQGFLASRSDCNTVTLGYEGSDYSASVYATIFGAYMKFFKKYAYHDSDPEKNSGAKYLENVSVKDLYEDVHTIGKKPILHPRTLDIMMKYNICGEIISCSNLSQRTRVVF